MRGTSPLREIRGLRRNRTGRHYGYSHQRVPDSSNKSTTKSNSNSTMTHRISGSSSVSTAASGSTTGSSSTIGSGSRSGSHSSGAMGLAERLLYGRSRSRARDDANEGLESMHHSLGNSKTGHYRNPLFQRRYAKLLQDEEKGLLDDHDGIIVAFIKRQITLRCLMLIVLIACVAALGPLENDAYNHTSNPPRHEIEINYQSLNNHASDVDKHMHLLNSLSNLTTPYDSKMETPLFLDIPLTGSTTVKRTISKCFNITMACEVGLRQPNYNEDELTTFASFYQGYTGHYVNVDLSTSKGIQRAKDLNLTRSGLAQVLSTGMLYESNGLFSGGGGGGGEEEEEEKEHKGRMFAVFAHPIARAIANYHHVKKATW